MKGLFGDNNPIPILLAQLHSIRTLLMGCFAQYPLFQSHSTGTLQGHPSVTEPQWQKHYEWGMIGADFASPTPLLRSQTNIAMGFPPFINPIQLPWRVLQGSKSCPSLRFISLVKWSIQLHETYEVVVQISPSYENLTQHDCLIGHTFYLKAAMA